MRRLFSFIDQLFNRADEWLMLLEPSRNGVEPYPDENTLNYWREEREYHAERDWEAGV